METRRGSPIPLLGALGDYGGPTETMPLMAGSPAIDAGTAISGITTDQRGFALDAPSPDIGAFQTNPLVVNTTIDGTGSPFGDLSLRQAVNLANALDAAEAITFSASVFATAQTITIDGNEIVLSDTGGTESITGPSAGVTISGGGLSRIFQIDQYATATLSGLTVSDASASGDGGGVYNDGTTTITDCTISGNTSSGTDGGGGVYNKVEAHITLVDTTISGNIAATDVAGGLRNAGTATLTDSTISDNSGVFGGGVFNNPFSTAYFTDCTISGNSSNYDGGGVDNYGGAYFANCTIYGNSVTRQFGGGVSNHGGTATFSDCTISGNSAPTGGGLYSAVAMDTTITNSIIALNVATTAPDVDGGVTSDGHNLIGQTNGSSGWVGSDLTGTVADPLNPNLGPLGDFGGSTETMPLLPGSPAIGGGTVIGGVSADERGQPRGNTLDIGAFQASVVVESTSASVNTAVATMTLPGAVSLADEFAGTEISFDPTAFASAQVIVLGGSELELNNTALSTTITGPTPGVTISGGGLSRVFRVDTGVTASLTGLTIRTDRPPRYGGGLYNLGTTTIADCTVSGNTAFFGGGLYNARSVPACH